MLLGFIKTPLNGGTVPIFNSHSCLAFPFLTPPISISYEDEIWAIKAVKTPLRMFITQKKPCLCPPQQDRYEGDCLVGV